MGIRTVGAWMCGWDWHHHGNILEDLNYFVSLYPTYQQLTRVSPFPGTPMWERLREEGRVREVPWDDVHFWSGAQRNVAMEQHETLNMTEYGYDLLYQTWGPSVLRRLDVQLSGYDYCRRSKNPLLRRHRALLHKKQCAMLWTNLRALDRHAPNGVVRRRGRKLDEKYRALVGEPTPVMESLARSMDLMSTAFRMKSFFDPMNRHPKEEPFKRYIYDNDGSRERATPYRIEMPKPAPSDRRGMRKAELSNKLLSMTLRGVRKARWRQTDRDIDDDLVTRISSGWLGFGF